MKHTKKLDPRPEGIYPRWEMYPPPPLVGGIRLLKIEKVNGDRSVDHMTLIPEQVDVLFSFILSRLKISHVL